MSFDISIALRELGFEILRDFELHQGEAELEPRMVWLSASPQPSASAIEQAALVAHQKRRINALRSEARTRIESAYPDWRQRSAALGLYPAEYVSTMQAAIASVIAASNTGEDAVDAAADVAAVEAVTVTWPVI